MSNFRFYHISEKYIRYLHSADNKVAYNKNERRPYVGIVLTVNNMNYYVPLESPKKNHKNIKGNGPVLKLDDGKLGIMGFNNMLPIPDIALISFDFNDIDDEKYRSLLIKQLSYCNSHKDIILNRANNTYKKTTSGKVPFYTKICCDFVKLERMSKKYDPDH